MRMRRKRKLCEKWRNIALSGSQWRCGDMKSYSFTSTKTPRTSKTSYGSSISAKLYSDDEDETTPTVFRRIILATRITVEPIVFLFMFGLFLMIFLQQQYFFLVYSKKALRNHDHDHIGCVTASTLKLWNVSTMDVQKSASRLLSYVNVPGQLLCIVSAMILGPLSDAVGRKFIFISVGIGVVLQGIVSIFILLFDLNLYLFVLGSVLLGICGGFASTLGASFAYAADVTSPGRSRSIRIAIIEAMVFIAGTISEGGAGKLLEVLNCSFWPLAVIYTVSGLLIILYTVIFLPEPFSRSERRRRAVSHRKGFGQLLNGIKLYFCPSSYSTWKLWAALLVLVIIVSNLIGAQLITALFQRGKPLKWGPATIGYFDIVAMGTHGLATLIILPLLLYLSFSDVTTAFIGVIFNAGVSLFTGFVRHNWEMFLIGVLSGMEAIVAPSSRSFMSKLVSPADQGALFSFALSVELLAAALSTAFYPNIFPVIISTTHNPGSVYFIMAGLTLVPIFLLSLIWCSMYCSSTWKCCGEKSLKMKGPPRVVTSQSESDDNEEEEEEANEEEQLLYSKKLLRYPTQPLNGVRVN